MVRTMAVPWPGVTFPASAWRSVPSSSGGASGSRGGPVTCGRSWYHLRHRFRPIHLIGSSIHSRIPYIPAIRYGIIWTRTPLVFPSADCLHFALYYFRLYSEPRSRAQWMRDSTHATPPPRIVAPSPWYLLGPGPIKQ